MSGCVTIKDPSKHLTEQKNPIFKLPWDIKKQKSHGLRILANQVLGRGHECQAAEGTLAGHLKENMVPRPSYEENDLDPLSDEMAGSGAMKEFIKNQCGNGGDMHMFYSDMKGFIKTGFIEAMLKEYSRTFSDARVQVKINKARQEKKIVFSDVFLRYAKAYHQGNFVLRDGTKLAPPSSNVTFSDGVLFNVAIDDNTLTGLTTVFLEALFEFFFPTPIIAELNAETNYKQKWCVKRADGGKSKTTKLILTKSVSDDQNVITEKPPCARIESASAINDNPIDQQLISQKSIGHNTIRDEAYVCEEGDKDPEKRKKQFFEMIYVAEISHQYFTTSNLKPTAQTLEQIDDFYCPIPVDNETVGISKNELKAIRLISSYVASGSKMVTGLGFRSIGGLGVSFGAFGKASIGDNDTLANIVETALEVFSRRLLEYELYLFFKSYTLQNKHLHDKQTQEAIDLLLKNIQ
jgi:hypothetical protein